MFTQFGLRRKWNSLLMLWFGWNLIFMCKIGRENRFCQYFLVFLEKIMIFFIFWHVHSIWVWNHNFWAKTNPNSVLKSWEYFQQNNGSGFLNLSLIFYYDWKFIWTLKSPDFSKFNPFFSILLSLRKKQGQKSRAVVL